MSHKSGPINPQSDHSDEQLLATLVSDDLFNVIRAIVPPPPPVETCSKMAGSIEVGGCSAVSEELFTRRPSEETLLEKADKQSFSANEAQRNLEEIFIQLVQPQKYTNSDAVMHSVSHLMIKWPYDEAVQVEAFNCLLCLSEQCDNLLPSRAAVPSILEAMKFFHRNELIQRMGVKLLKKQNFLKHVKKKIEVANVIFNSLCNLPKVDDFMVHARDIVGELCPSEKALLRSKKRYIEMLLDFPNRKNRNITVCLCWPALDTLALLADCDGRWDVLIEVEGEARLQRLSHRPELEDRCRALLRKLFVTVNGSTLDSGNTTAFSAMSTVIISSPNERQKTNPLQRENMFDECSWATEVPQKSPKCREVQRRRLNGFRVKTTSNLLAEEHIVRVQPVDELITRKPPTPPPTIADNDDDLYGQFSDEEIMLSPFTPFGSPSPSYSPPPQTNKLLSNGEPPSLKPSKVSVKTHQKNNMSEDKTKSVSSCIICQEPKGKQTLLSKQLNQISHCLLQPCNVLLSNCLRSNLCEEHRI